MPEHSYLPKPPKARTAGFEWQENWKSVSTAFPKREEALLRLISTQSGLTLSSIIRSVTSKWLVTIFGKTMTAEEITAKFAGSIADSDHAESVKKSLKRAVYEPHSIGPVGRLIEAVKANDTSAAQAAIEELEGR